LEGSRFPAQDATQYKAVAILESKIIVIVKHACACFLLMYAEKLRGRDFAGRGGFVMKGCLKDVTLMLSTAEAVGAPLEVGKCIWIDPQSGRKSDGKEATFWHLVTKNLLGYLRGYPRIYPQLPPDVNELAWTPSDKKPAIS
jgi:hypothetical protein